MISREDFIKVTIGDYIMNAQTVDMKEIPVRVETARFSFDYLTKKYSDLKQRERPNGDRDPVEKLQGVR